MDKSLAEALASGIDRDRQLGSTRAGPHRADLRLVYDERQARKRVSRGQQKLLACGLILAAMEFVQTSLDTPLLLLLDDPTAELDSGSLARLMTHVAGLDCQVIATTLEAEKSLFEKPPKMFTEASTIAAKPSIFEVPAAPAMDSPASTATASSAPTMITDEMALVTAISGVCSAGVTLHTT